MRVSSWSMWFCTCPQGAGFFIIEPRPSAPSLGEGDLYVIDVFVVPQRFEQGVGKAQDHKVLNHFFAQVMVDAVNLFFREGAAMTEFSSSADLRSCPKGFSITTRCCEPWLGAIP